MTKEEIHQAFARLNGLLGARGFSLTVDIVGGAVMALAYGGRDSTKDVDAIRVEGSPAETWRALVAEAARDLSLPDDWLNNRAAVFSMVPSPGPILFAGNHLTVRAVSTQQMLAMKRSALRAGMTWTTRTRGCYSPSFPATRRPYGRSSSRSWCWAWRRGGGRTSTHSGGMSMDPVELARAAVELRTLDLREWVNEANRRHEPLTSLAPPATDDPTLRTVAAALIEVLARRRQEPAPQWAAEAPPMEAPLWLTPFAARHPDLARRCIEDGPEPLRRRRLWAMPDYLSVA